jgi:hypothetical protein
MSLATVTNGAARHILLRLGTTTDAAPATPGRSYR